MISEILGKKLGMTQVYDAQNVLVPVTVGEAGPCAVVQVKTAARDGYHAVQLGFARQKEKNASAGELGHAKKAGLDSAPRVLAEVRLDAEAKLKVGDVVTAAAFTEALVPTKSTDPAVLENSAQDALRRIGMAVFELGGYLLLLKEACPHGQFLPALERLNFAPLHVRVPSG